AAGLAVGFWHTTDELRQNWNEDKRWNPTCGKPGRGPDRGPDRGPAGHRSRRGGPVTARDGVAA
ncbi:hypothetical protein, partial [Actinomadura geliboluensis]